MKSKSKEDTAILKAMEKGRKTKLLTPSEKAVFLHKVIVKKTINKTTVESFFGKLPNIEDRLAFQKKARK
jgi:hypothetical protein